MEYLLCWHLVTMPGGKWMKKTMRYAVLDYLRVSDHHPTNVGPRPRVFFGDPQQGWVQRSAKTNSGNCIPEKWTVTAFCLCTAVLYCKGKMQYLLTLQVSRYCLLSLQGSIVYVAECWSEHVSAHPILPCKAKRQYLLTLQNVSKYCLIALHSCIIWHCILNV